MYKAEHVDAWKRIVDFVHIRTPGKIAIQLGHAGRKGASKPLWEGDAEPLEGGAWDLVSASPLPYFPDRSQTPREMTRADMDEVVADYSRATEYAEAAGFDLLELHMANGYLLAAFISPLTNQRTDEYGGSLANRSRFAIELIEAVRAAVGPDFPIIFRFSQWKQQDYSARLVTTPEALGEFLEPLSAAGVDIFHCSTRRFWEPEFEGSDLNLAGWTRQLTGKPTITVGSVGLDGEFLQFMIKTDKVAQPANIEGLLERLNKQEFDLVAVGRALICDPDWALKVKEGRMQDILPFSREALKTLA